MLLALLYQHWRPAEDLESLVFDCSAEVASELELELQTGSFSPWFLWLIQGKLGEQVEQAFSVRIASLYGEELKSP